MGHDDQPRGTQSAKAPKKMDGTRRVWDVVVMVVGAVLVAAVLGFGKQSVDHEVRIGKIESNRFTSQDGAAMEARMKEWIEEHFPPKWLHEDLRELKHMVRENGKKIDQHVIQHRDK